MFVSTIAPRIPWPHRHRQEVARSRQGPQLQQDDGRPPQDVEAAQHPLALALPLSGALSDGSCGGVRWWCVGVCAKFAGAVPILWLFLQRSGSVA